MVSAVKSSPPSHGNKVDVGLGDKAYKSQLKDCDDSSHFPAIAGPTVAAFDDQELDVDFGFDMVTT